MRLKLTPQIFKSPDYSALLLDGKYLAYRTQYGHTGGLSYSGVKTGMYYGFFNTIQQLMHKFYPIYLCIMWDSPGKESIRKQTFPEYKNRDKWDKLTEQQKKEKKEFSDAYENLMVLCEDLGIASYILKGYEADDLFALWINRFSSYNYIVIVTRDEDMYQLISKDVSIYDPDNKKVKDLKWFTKEYGIEPKLWANVKAMGGCRSDTVPGIKGVGEETALKYYRNEPIKKKGIDSEENIALVNKYYNLVVLPHPNLKNMHLPFKTSNVNKNKFFELCQQMGFRSFIDDLNKFEPLFDL